MNLNKKWSLGFKDRGHHHGDFAVIEKQSEVEVLARQATTLVVEATNRELADHIIQVHNQQVDLTKALERSVMAIDDWLHQYAGEFCDEHDVKETGKRISQNGGTLAYIADVQARNREALGRPNN